MTPFPGLSSCPLLQRFRNKVLSSSLTPCLDVLFYLFSDFTKIRIRKRPACPLTLTLHSCYAMKRLSPFTMEEKEYV